MKKTVIAGLMTLSLMASSAFAGDTIIKRCKTTLGPLDKESLPIDMDFKIVNRDGNIITVFTENVNGVKSTSESTAEINSYKVREGLEKNLDNMDDGQLDTLNPGEMLILHAMAFDNDPEMNKVFNSGIKKLSQVRSVKTYLMNANPQDIGSTTIVEAFDKNGKAMGSFLGGFLVSACK